ncbi:hypothetical protein [Staphylococcus devriesei]|uniref:hypothetical protein n=1 Tax=Staphylococcus devriesei TaxID=586733 RepID=UPI000DFF6ECD|nr:hypothetical protein [Staphylococcus devriesei]SUM03694.1 Uncharacterised protein [Staphylococcus devriesei]
MLILKFQEKNSQSVIYKYYPNDDENIKPGVIHMDIDTLQIINAEKSGIEDKENDNYFIHAIERIESNTSKKIVSQVRTCSLGIEHLINIKFLFLWFCQIGSMGSIIGVKQRHIA